MALAVLGLAMVGNGHAATAVQIYGPSSTLIGTGTGTRNIWVQVGSNPAVPGATCTIELYPYGTTGPVLYSGTAAVPNSTSTATQVMQVPINVGQLGIYSLRVQVKNAGGGVVWTSNHRYASVPPRANVGPPFMGVCTHLCYSISDPAARVLDLIRLAGFGWIRDNYWWDSIEPTAGTYTFNSHQDDIVSNAQSRGLKVLAILGKATPAYNFTGGLPDSTTNAAFGRYAVKCMQRYPYVLDWEILNEPDDYDPTTVYTPLLQAVYNAMKTQNSAVNVISCGGGGAGHNVGGQYESGVLGGGGIGYQNAFSAHPYLGDNPPEIGYTATGGPITTFNVSTIWPYLTTLANNHPNPATGTLKVWMTEMGWSVYPDGETEMEQAAYFVRAYLLAARQGWGTVSRLFWYEFQNGGTDTDQESNFGLINADYSPKPAYVAASVFSASIGTYAFSQAVIDTSTAKVYKYGPRYAIWGVTGPTSVTFALPAGTYTLRDWQGRDTTITSTGTYTMTASINPSYIF
ncbi:Endo-1,4-beta-xylanase, GH35 family [Verrucomicrobium sp. GAS474]|uniref:cellulase family glycosylhydrolase n=1 Tax=Verrucomicrobium sp. GAS474 TaxID=1882831 RepID=UPI00087C7F96|nr:cellulase family glycosylhydrolase [Verrucomicrobium sp. GAS474]SDU11730.1 Endo-1,4-beta-xylanase, GH35 family [Verrucomicrobium sp. GAS474]